MPAVPLAMKIWEHSLTPIAHRLLWWLISQMDDDSELSIVGWRRKAATDLGVRREWSEKCARELRAAGLIEFEASSRLVRVVTKNIMG